MTKKAFVSGCFDVLHSGHVAFFREAAAYGDLHVALGSDKTVFGLKGRTPVNNEQERLFMIKSVSYVKVVFISQGSGGGILKNISGALAIHLFFYPPVWPVLLTGYGYRKGIIGRADLLAICGLSCLFPLPAVLMSPLGLELWRRLWIRKRSTFVPALPGMLGGLLIYVAVHLTRRRNALV